MFSCGTHKTKLRPIQNGAHTRRCLDFRSWESGLTSLMALTSTPCRSDTHCRYDIKVCATGMHTRTPRFLVKVNSDGTLVITADDFGGVKLFNAPCVVEDAPSLRHAAHSSHVMGIRFLLGEHKPLSFLSRACGPVARHDLRVFSKHPIPYLHPCVCRRKPRRILGRARPRYLSMENHRLAYRGRQAHKHHEPAASTRVVVRFLWQWQERRYQKNKEKIRKQNKRKNP